MRSTATSRQAAESEADRLEADYSQERLGKLAFAGGWENDKTSRVPGQAGRSVAGAPRSQEDAMTII